MAEILKNKCLECRTELDRTEGIRGEANPHPGDVSICCQCGAVALFDDDLKFRKASKAEMAELMEDRELAFIINESSNFAKRLASRRN